MAIYYVDASRPDDTGDGLSEGAAKRTIRAARNIAASGDTIKIKRGYCYEPTTGYFFPALTSFNGGSLTITDYGTGDLPIWDGLTYEPAATADWTYIATGIGGVWKKVFAATYIRRVFQDSSSTGILTTDRVIGDGLRRCPVGTPAITSTTQNESEANIVAALQTFQDTAPWAPGGAATSYALYMWTGSAVVQPPAYYSGLAFIQADLLTVGAAIPLEIQDMSNVLVENQHFRGFRSSGVRVYAENADSGNTDGIIIQDCSATHFWGYGFRVARAAELAPTNNCTNGIIRRCTVNAYYGAAEQELTLGEAVMSAWDGIIICSGADTWTIEDCTVTDSGHGAFAVDGSVSGLSKPTNITFQNNTATFNTSHSYARGILAINCVGAVFSGNTITGQNVRSQVAAETVVNGNIWEDCRASIRKPGTNQWIACESYYYDNSSGLGDSVRWIPVWPEDVQIINNRVNGSFENGLINLMAYDSPFYGTPLWPSNSVEFRNNSCVSDDASVLLLQSNGSTNAADITQPVFANNVFYAPGAAGTNRVQWNATASSPLTDYTLSTAPGFTGTLETNPMADTKISALSDGTAVQATDNIPAQRGATNVRVQIDLSDKVVGAASSVDSEIALFSGTGGKTIKRATTTGVLRADSGVISAATANTDYVTPARSKMLAADTWANRPDATTNGEYIFPCTDIGIGGFALFYSDGTDWRPVGGRILLSANAGSLASPLSTTTAVTSATLQSVTVPAGLIPPKGSIQVFWQVRRTGTNATNGWQIRLGTTGTASDAVVSAFSVAATNNLDSYLMGKAFFGSSTTSFVTPDYITLNGSGAAGARDSSTNVNTDSAMTLGLYLASANASDTFLHVAYQVWLEA